MEMRQLRSIGLCLVAILMASAMAAASASALEAPEIGRCVLQSGGAYANNSCTKDAKKVTEEKYEWEPGAVKAKFTGTGGAATLETVAPIEVKCKRETSNGEFTSPTTVGNIAVTFYGCEETGFKCETAGAKEKGEIVVNTLSGKLVWEHKATKKVAVDLFPASTELFVAFACGPAKAKVKGSVLVNVKAGKMEESLKEAFKGITGKVGHQNPEEYETASGERVKDILETQLANNETAPFEQSSQTVTNTQKDEELLEVNWFV